MNADDDEHQFDDIYVINGFNLWTFEWISLVI